LGATPAMERLLGSESGRLSGQALWEFLTPESAHGLRGQVAAGHRRPELLFTMTFIGAGSGPRVVICNLDVQPNAFALLCEPVSAERAAPELRQEEPAE
jgi:hypothetical protein